MKIIQSADIKKLDAYTIENEPISSINLMERAACALKEAISKRWSKKVPVKIFAGPGNNGGDALALARLLIKDEYNVETFLFNTAGKLSDDCQTNKELLKQMDEAPFTEVSTKFEPPILTADDLVIDGLFGSGLNKSLNGGFAAVVKYINASASTVVSIDIPSGLMGEDNAYNIKAHIICANLTLSLQLPKLSFLFAENEDIVGEWELLNIGLSNQAMETVNTEYELLEEDEMRNLIYPRKKFAHKGNFGHALLIAGSYGMAGAAVLSAKACLRSGVGLLTVHTPVRNNDILQMSVPEAIVRPDIHDNYFIAPVDTDDYQAIGIGPGLGQEAATATALKEQIKLCQIPLVMDADALNILSENRDWLSLLPADTILTPHPKEMDRLVGNCHDSFERLTKARELAMAKKLYIVLKGAYTTIITPKGKCWFNITGNSGMATAGCGDVLTGVILSLLAQGYDAEKACKLGVYIHGLAGDFAAAKVGKISLLAGDVVDSLSLAWSKIS
ncbi:MAG: NAD(P)H-hydrate dehydratase [Bacteroidaceae bacterium]